MKRTIVIALAATLITAAGSWVPSFWNDEAATLRLAQLPIPQLLEFVTQKDAVHALYALFMHFWIHLFGNSELAVRAPSAIAVGACAAGVWLLGKNISGSRAGVLAAIVVTILPRVAANGIEARSYALATALLVWVAVTMLRASAAPQRSAWVLPGVLTALAVGIFLYVALCLPAIVVLAAATSHDRHRAARAASATVGIGALVATPIALIAAGQTGQIAWLDTQPVNIWTVLVEPFFLDAWWLCAAIIVILFASAITARRKRISVHEIALTCWILLPTVALLVATALGKPMFTPRYLSVCTPAVALLVGTALTSFSRRTGTVLAVALILAASPSLVQMRTETSKPGAQDFREIATTIRAQAQPGDAFVLDNTGPVSLRPRVALAAYPDDFAQLHDVALRKAFPAGGSYSDTLWPTNDVVHRIKQGQRVWLVSRTGHRDEILHALLDRGWRASTEQRVATDTIYLLTVPTSTS